LKRVVLAGNPNAGKTTLFNALTGLRMRTANFHGTTVELKQGTLSLEGQVEPTLLDLPGMYSLRAVTPEEKVAAAVLKGEPSEIPPPDLILAVVDASNLDRNLFLLSQLTECRLPMIVVMTMLDIAQDHGIRIDLEKLSARLGCPVIPVNVPRREGLDTLKAQIADWAALESPVPLPHPPPQTVCGGGCGSCPFSGRYGWSERIAAEVVRSAHVARSRTTERLDAVFTHPALGVLAFLLVMTGLFALIFALAGIPMALLEGFFGVLSRFAGNHLPDNLLGALIQDGIIPGVGGVLVFLPQILILFFALSLLEDTGYLSRAAFVMDRLMKRVGLPGTAFVPMVSGHACAIPAILSTRVIEDRRDRLVTILTLPLMSCSARIPVYMILVSLLFPTRPLYAALSFTGAYVLGVLSALGSAWLLKKTILPGESKPLLLELPSYKTPGIRNAFHHAWQKGAVFLKQAGGIILLISMVLWVLATFPRSEPPAEAQALRAAGAFEEAANLEAAHALEKSLMGRLGRGVEPLVRPLGYDWRIGVGVLSSFAAREVIVSTLSIVFGLGEEGGEEPERLTEILRQARHPDGRPLFTAASCFSLLVFYVLAMQCLPTQVVTRSETGSWKWAALQLAYMSLLAYSAAFLVYQGLSALGFGG